MERQAQTSSYAITAFTLFSEHAKFRPVSDIIHGLSDFLK